MGVVRWCAILVFAVLLGFGACHSLPICLQDSDCRPLYCVDSHCVPKAGREAANKVEGFTEDFVQGDEYWAEEFPLNEVSDSGVSEREPSEKKFERSFEESNVEVLPESSVYPEPIKESKPEPVIESIPEQDKLPDLKPGQLLRCGGRWVDPHTDSSHCGFCYRKCNLPKRCCGGMCGIGRQEVCNERDDDCDGMIDEDARNCVTIFAGVNLDLEGPALWTPLSGPMGLVFDKHDNLYIAERNRSRIRKLDLKTDILTTLAGSVRAFYPPVKGKTPANATKLRYPTYLSYEPKNHILYVSEGLYNAFRRIRLGGSPLEVETLLFGKRLSGLAVGSNALVYLADFDAGIFQLHKFAGREVFDPATGLGSVAFSKPHSMVVDTFGNLFIAEKGPRIRKVDAKKKVSIFCGGTSGFADGKCATAMFKDIRQMITDKAGNLYVADAGNHRIRKITPGGVVTTIAGSTAGYKNAKGTAAQFFWPSGLAFHSSGDLYVADTGNQFIRKIDTKGNVTTVAGAVNFRKGARFPGQLHGPADLAFDKKNGIYILDSENHRVLYFDAKGKQSVVFGHGAQRFITEYWNSPGSPQVPVYPTERGGLVLDNDGNLYIFDYTSNRLYVKEPGGKIRVFGGPTAGYRDGIGSQILMHMPFGAVLGKDNTVYFSARRNMAIRSFHLTKGTKTVTGNGTQAYKDGPLSSALFNFPLGIAYDSKRDRLYVADAGNRRIRVIDFAKKMTSTIAGSGAWGCDNGNGNCNGNCNCKVDGSCSCKCNASCNGDCKCGPLTASFGDVIDLLVGPKGHLYVTEPMCNIIRKIEIKADGKAGLVTTFIGSGKKGRKGGNPLLTEFSYPGWIKWRSEPLKAGSSKSIERFYISDFENNLILLYTPL